MVNAIAYSSAASELDPIRAPSVRTDLGKPIAAGALAESTLVRTPKGERMIGELKAGDLVRTRDAGLQPVLWRSAPLILPMVSWRGCEKWRGVLGTARQRIVVQSARVQVLCGQDIALAALGDLAPDAEQHEGHAVYLLLPRRALIDLNGAFAESLDVRHALAGGLPPKLRARILKASPKFRHAQGSAAYISPCPILSRSEIRRLA